jgi:PKD repeat protein
MNIRRPIITLVIVLMLVVTACSHGTMLPLTKGPPSGWPTTWTGLSTDPNESGCDVHRNVADVDGDRYALYYATDSQYLYLRMEIVDPPGWPSLKPEGDARYKWWFDTSGTAAYVHGTTVEKAEFLLILEDLTDNSDNPNTTRDQLGELTLMDDLNNDGFTKRWDQAKPPNYTINNAQTAPTGNSSWWRRELGTGTPGTGGPQGVMGADIGYRIDNSTIGGNFVDMYVSWAALGNPSSLCLIWATDNQNNNLDQTPNCDRPEETSCLSVCVAAFNATPTSGCAPVIVNFTDQSTGSPTSWNWSFPGGTPSSHTGQMPPPVTYNAAGSYNVTLIVSNVCSSDNETKSVTVYANPRVNITPDGGKLTCATTFILLTADTTGSPCTVISYQWYNDDVALGDETGSTLSVTAPGTYKVEVECTNGCNAEDFASVTEDTSRPTVNVANVVVCERETATLIATVSGCTVKRYQWYEGTSSSGTLISGANFTTYLIPNASTANAGAYTCLVECESSCKSEDHGTLTVNHSPRADFSGSPISGCAPLTVVFTDLSTGAPTSWSWDVDGGGNEDYNTQNPSHTYTSAGTYTVSLTVSNACGSDSDTKKNYITVDAKPTATASSNSPICEGSTIVLTGGPGGMTSYSWTGPNGFSSSSQNATIPNATTAMTGTYTLTVTNGGCTSDPASTVVVVNKRPTADAGADTEITEGGSVMIGGSPTGSGGTAPYTYRWTPTTGLNNAGIANPTASPSVTTTYTVTVTDSKGCTDDDDVTMTLTHGWWICGFVYRAGTREALAGWEVILEKKTSPWHEVQRTVTDADGKYCCFGLGAGDYRVREVVKSGWNQVSPVPNEHLVTLPGGASDPEYGPFLNFENEQSQEDPGPTSTVGWEASPIDKLAVLRPWIALLAAFILSASLLVLGRRRAHT